MDSDISDVDIASTPAPPLLDAETPRIVLAAAHRAVVAGDPGATLAIVVHVEGSTYVGRAAAALFATDAQVGWLSGGCLEPEIARAARDCAVDGRIGWLDLDTRDDGEVLSGSGAGCRGRMRLVLLPLAALPGIGEWLADWLGGGIHLALVGDASGRVDLWVDGHRETRWTLPVSAADVGTDWNESWPRSPEAWLFGAGPESEALLATLATLGWRTTLVERRPRWRDAGAWADAHIEATPGAALVPTSAHLGVEVGDVRVDAALVMNHHFELDRESLAALAATSIPYIGLLGPGRRRQDLFRVLPAAAVAALAPRLRSPVGLDLGGRGAAAISLSIAAQVQAWRFGREMR